MTVSFTDDEAAEALLQLVGSSGWVAVALARGYLLARSGATDEVIARGLFESGSFTLTKARALAPDVKRQGFRALVPARERTGSAENPITKLFPATITEERFVERLDALAAVGRRASTLGQSQTRWTERIAACNLGSRSRRWPWEDYVLHELRMESWRTVPTP
jgi:hypothetical protein